MEQLATRFLQFTEKHKIDIGLPWMVAVSGGLDSVVLSHLCATLGIRFGIAHCNFHLRAAAADGDAAFVAELAHSLNVPFFVTDFDTSTIAVEQGKGIQETARQLRYEWFNQLLKQSNDYQYIATAHHADDQIETLLFQFFRGTGIRGLQGIQPVRQKTIRPLLFAERKELEIYAKTFQLDWREDESNAATNYTRNFIRHEVIPLLRNRFEGFTERQLGQAANLNQALLLYEDAVSSHIKKLVLNKEGVIHIPYLKWKALPAAKTILWEIIAPFGFLAGHLESAWEKVQRPQEQSTYTLASTNEYRLLKNRNWLLLLPNETNAIDHLNVLDAPAEFWDLAHGKLHFEVLSATLGNSDLLKSTASPLLQYIDAQNIEYPLVVRRWKQGDYFYPLGMTKKKKVARFLIDQKVSKPEKETIWVLESNKKIVWIIGYRIDNRFKVKESSANILRITFLPLA